VLSTHNLHQLVLYYYSHSDWCALSNATALTVSNITSTLTGIRWKDIGEHILCLPGSKCDEISSQCSTDEERTAALVREWLLRDPLASWRRIIRGLHWYDASTKEHSLGDSIVHYAEELTGNYMYLRFRFVNINGYTPARPSPPFLVIILTQISNNQEGMGEVYQIRRHYNIIHEKAKLAVYMYLYLFICAWSYKAMTQCACSGNMHVLTMILKFAEPHVISLCHARSFYRFSWIS
jgi:hypothetical protein